MDILHIEARYKHIIVLPNDFIEQLPKKITLFTTVQFLNSVEPIKEQLEKNGIEVCFVRPRHTLHKGQILGCSTTKFETDADFLYIGDGLFHPKALVLRNNKTVYTYNPKTNETAILDNSIALQIRKKIIASYAKFASSKNIGVLLTLKPGQQKEYMTTRLKEQFPDKNFYFFADHSYNFQSLLDFPFIEVFLNTMCERIGYDDMDVQGLSIINLEDIWDIRDGFFD